MILNQDFITKAGQQQELEVLLWNFDVDDYVLQPFAKIGELYFEIPQEILEC